MRAKLINESYSEFRNLKDIFLASKHLWPDADIQMFPNSKYPSLSDDDQDAGYIVIDFGKKYFIIQYQNSSWGNFKTGVIYLNGNRGRGYGFGAIDQLEEIISKYK